MRTTGSRGSRFRGCGRVILTMLRRLKSGLVSLAVVAVVGLSSTTASASQPTPRSGGLAAVTMAGSSLTSLSRCPTQTLTIINGAAVSTAAIDQAKVEAALTSGPLRAAWGTPCIHFGPGGWRIILAELVVDGEAVGGVHAVDGQGQPYAAVSVGIAANTGSWQQAFTHEVDEMLVDPYLDRYINGELVEVDDPVEMWGYQEREHTNLFASDFVLPSWFEPGSPGPWDYMDMASGPLDTSQGVAPNVRRAGARVQLARREGRCGRGRFGFVGASAQLSGRRCTSRR